MVYNKTRELKGDNNDDDSDDSSLATDCDDEGGFPTCDLCNRSNDLLRARASVHNEGQREMILKFKRLQLDQQTKERDDMDNRPDLAKTYFRAAGQPTHAFILVDAASNDAVGFPGTNIGNIVSYIEIDDRNTKVNRLMTCEVHALWSDIDNFCLPQR